MHWPPFRLAIQFRKSAVEKSLWGPGRLGEAETVGEQFITTALQHVQLHVVVSQTEKRQTGMYFILDRNVLKPMLVKAQHKAG